MKPALRILIVDDSEEDALLILREMRRHYAPAHRRVDTESDLIGALEEQTWDIVLSAFSMPGFSGMAALKVVRSADPDLPFFMISGAIGEETAVEAMKAGAQDFILKDRLSRLLPAIERELREAQIRREHRQSQKQIRRQLERLTALRAIDIAISSSVDLRLTLNLLLEQVLALLGLDAAGVLLVNPYTYMLEFAAARGFRSTASTRAPLRLDQSVAGRVVLDGNPIYLPDLTENMESFARPEIIQSEGFVAYYAVPLLAKGQIKGVLEGFHRTPTQTDTEWLDFLETMAGQAAIAIDNALLFGALQRSNVDLMVAYDTTLEGWVKALDLRDKETEGHSQRVTEMTIRLAHTLEVSESEIVNVRRGALLHDIGKLGIPDSILLKPGPLTDEEWEIMRLHPAYAYEWLFPISYLRPAVDIPYCHHEKWDGTGYPRGLKGEQIPLAARIFTVVDVWDALCSDRPYRSAWPEAQAREHIHKLSGKQFDPGVVEAFEKMLANGQEDEDADMPASSSQGKPFAA